MSISLSIGTTNIPVGSLTDLENSASTLLSLGQEFAGVTSSQLSAVPAGLRSTKISYSGASPKWTMPGALPVSFSLSGSTAGSISILLPGDTMFSYTDAFPTTVTTSGTTTNDKSSVPQTVGPNDAYISLELDFTLSGTATGNYSTGEFGFTVNGTGSTSITVAFYKRCNPTDTVEAALIAAFGGFVLPLHENTLTNIKPGDYLHYLFTANLQLGLGATAGVDKVFGAGQISQDLTTINAVVVNASAKLEVQAGAKLAVDYTYGGVFEIVLWKEATNLAHFHLFRSQNQDLSGSLNIGVTVTSDPSASIQVSTTQLISDLVARMPASIQPAMTNLLTTGVAKTPINTFVTEANTKITTWLKPLQSGQFSLAFSADKSNQRLLLTNYTIDTTKPYQPAWSDMMAGKFVDAFELPNTGVSLDAGSGVEAVYKTTTSISLNLFGKLNIAWTTTDINASSFVYLGDGIFHLIVNTGVQQIFNMNGVEKKLDVYFALDLDIPAAGGAKPAPELHIVFQAINNPTYGMYIVSMLSQLLQGSQSTTLQTAFSALAHQANTSQALHLVFSQTAYQNIKASVLDKNGVAADDTQDRANYSLYTAAAQVLFTGEPTDMQINGQTLGYDFWAQTQIASQGGSGDPSLMKPSRTDWPFGFPQQVVSFLTRTIGNQTAIPPTSIYYCLGGANAFMNLCADLQALGQSATVTIKTWEDLVSQLQHLVSQDIGTFLEFLPSTTLALANAVKSAPTVVAAPDPTLPQGTSLGVTLSY